MRVHVSVPNHIIAKLDEMATDLMCSRSIIISHCLDVGIAAVRDAPRSGLLASLQTKAAKATQPKTIDEYGIRPTEYAGSIWFQLGRVCDALGTRLADVRIMLDDDDIENIDGEACIADLGIKTALSVAREAGADVALLKRFEAWIDKAQA